ncbi:MAG TPA: radical SAM protein [Deltaproteobacteria bacterium]|nr:radical SAM protein [Deltaproteobacteria bacterium]
MFEPSYLRLYRDGTLAARTRAALDILKACRLCPRACGVDRTHGQRGLCATGRLSGVASYGAHYGEEAPLVGTHGSGTIFFTGCNLGCCFCQNYDISHAAGTAVTSSAELAAMMVELARAGCHNINFVTPSHVIPQILEALILATRQGLRVPLVYNSSGYDTVESLRLLDGIFDIYMPDFKFWDGAFAERFCRAPDYPEVAQAAVKEMHAQVGDLVIEQGLAVRGLLVRHLVMPNDVAGTAAVMDFLAREVSPRTYVNVMMQYRPCFRAVGDVTIGRRVTAAEYTRAFEAALRAGLHRLDKGA